MHSPRPLTHGRVFLAPHRYCQQRQRAFSETVVLWVPQERFRTALMRPAAVTPGISLRQRFGEGRHGARGRRLRRIYAPGRRDGARASAGPKA